MIKTKITITIGLVLLCVNISAQIKTWSTEGDGGLPAPDQPKIISIDTFLIFDSSNSIESSLNYDSTLMIQLMDYDVRVLRSDSSVLRNFFVENGILKNHRRFGKWNIIRGYYKDNVRIPVSQNLKYYFNDYEIYYNPTITKYVKFDLNSDSAICCFIYTNKDHNSVNLKLNYWIDSNGKIMTKCLTENGVELFSVSSEVLEDELKILLSGGYNRIIFKL